MTHGSSPPRGARLSTLFRRLGRLLARRRHAGTDAHARWMDIDRLA